MTAEEMTKQINRLTLQNRIQLCCLFAMLLVSCSALAVSILKPTVRLPDDPIDLLKVRELHVLNADDQRVVVVGVTEEGFDDTDGGEGYFELHNASGRAVAGMSSRRYGGFSYVRGHDNSNHLQTNPIASMGIRSGEVGLGGYFNTRTAFMGFQADDLVGIYLNPTETAGQVIINGRGSILPGRVFVAHPEEGSPYIELKARNESRGPIITLHNDGNNTNKKITSFDD